MVIRRGVEADVAAILAIVNDAARAYRGVIPADRWHDPYMSLAELEKEISGGVVFWVAERDGRVAGVMGVQDKGDVALVRRVVGDRVLSAQRVHGGAGQPQRPAPAVILVDPRETGRDVGCPRRFAVEAGRDLSAVTLDRSVRTVLYSRRSSS